VFVLAVPCFASVLTWQGDAGTGWNSGTVASNTNWTDGTASPGDQRKPAAGDVLVFNTGGTYSGDLTLGGATVDVDGITVGDGADHLGQANFGVLNRILGSSGKIRLGAGGLTASMFRETALPNETIPDEARNIRFNTDIELTTSTTIRRLGNFGVGAKTRQLYIDGVISGGTLENPVNLVIDNAGLGSGNRGVHFTRSNTFIGDLTVNGTLLLDKADGFGASTNLVRIGTGAYIHMYCRRILHRCSTGQAVTIGRWRGTSPEVRPARRSTCWEAVGGGSSLREVTRASWTASICARGPGW
jgi:hypothetical protein